MMKYIYFIKNPKELRILILKKLAWLFDDKSYVKLLFKLSLGHEIDLCNPKSFNEKLNWIKLYDRNPLYTKMADKYEVKEYVRKIIGDEYVVPCYGVFNSFSEIDFSALPNQFVLKATHDSGGATICRDKNAFDYKLANIKFKKDLKRNFYLSSREWPYKNIKPRIIVDKLLDDHTGTELRDYKFWCFNGTPTLMYCTIKGKNVYENFYDMNFNPVDINHGFPRHLPEFDKPAGFELMKELATKLAKDAPAFIRIDFFDIDGHVYFGEFTFFDWAGLRPFTNHDIDLKLGDLIHLKS